MRLLSIDPGQKGGMTLFDLTEDTKFNLTLVLVDTIETPYDSKLGEYRYQRIEAILKEWKPDLVVIEEVLLIASSGTTNAGRVGEGMGMWKTFFHTLGIDFTYINPAKWTKALGLKNDRKLTVTQNKLPHVELASKLYPNSATKMLGKRGGFKDGLADSILIGHYWYLHFLSLQEYQLTKES